MIPSLTQEYEQDGNRWKLTFWYGRLVRTEIWNGSAWVSPWDWLKSKVMQ